MINSSSSVSLPARTLNTWWISQIQLSVNPDTGVIRLQYLPIRGDSSGFVPTPSNTGTSQVITDIAAAFANDNTSLSNIIAAQTAIEAVIAQDLTNKGLL